PSFSYSKSLNEYETPLLFSLDRPLENLAEDLTYYFSGRKLRMLQIFERHHIGRRYVLRNYKAALTTLEAEGKIAADPTANRRPRRKGEVTFGDNVLVTFPTRSK